MAALCIPSKIAIHGIRSCSPRSGHRGESGQFYIQFQQMHLYIHTVHLDEENLRFFFLRPIITHNLPFLHNLNVSLSAVWEGVGSMEVEEPRRKNAPGVGINRGELVDFCYQRCSDDLNVNLLLPAEHWTAGSTFAASPSSSTCPRM